MQKLIHNLDNRLWSGIQFLNKLNPIIYETVKNMWGCFWLSF